jgi:FkbM family methyltransferase
MKKRGEIMMEYKELKKRLNPHLLDFIDVKEQNQIRKVDPISLLSCNRFDIVAKYIYIKFKENGLDSEWGKRIYEEHIRAFNRYEEGDGSGKTGKEAFINSYDNLLESIKNDGFNDELSIVPVNSHNIPIDGAHRVAGCLYYHQKISVAQISDCLINYDYDFFLHNGLSVKYCDAIAYEYCKLKTNIYIVVVYPSAIGKDNQINNILNNHGKIIYRKNINLNEQGLLNLVIQIYSGETWLGNWDDGFRGAIEKARPCFREGNPLRIFVYELQEDPTELVDIKAQIRNLFNIENHSVHINDTHEQTIGLAQILLNENSIHLMNHMRINESNKKFSNLLTQYTRWLEENQLDKECFCIDGSSVMGIYGIREPADLDFLQYGINEIGSNNDKINCHNSELHYHIKSKDDIIFNPENHFYFMGIKFSSLDILAAMKIKRGESKDLVDVKLIKNFTKNKNNRCLNRGILFMRFKLTISKILTIGRKIKSIPKRGFKKLKKIFTFIYDSIRPFVRTIRYMGFKVYYSKGTSIIQVIREYKIYEKDLCNLIVEKLQESKCKKPIFLDAGANIGLISVFVLSKIPETLVYAFEPGPHQNELFKKTIDANRVSDKITLYKEALGYRAGTAKFAVHNTKDVSGDGFIDTRSAGTVNYIETNVNTLDNWWEEACCPKINVIKIDTEGAELWILKGAEKLISSCKPILFFEMWPKFTALYGYSCADLLKWLDCHDYSLYSLSKQRITLINLKEYSGVEATFMAESNG